jgi:hypothetical protein
MQLHSVNLLGLIAGACISFSASAIANTLPHNVILFVPDGLRAAIVSRETAPAMAALRDEGVNFQNSHSLFPTFTTANASAFATGHQLGDTGDFSNTIFVGFPVKAARDSLTPFLESNAVLEEIDDNERYAGNYLDEESILAAAQKKGYSTAAIGKVGPVAIQNLTAMKNSSMLILDDSTGPKGIVALPKEWQDAIEAAKLKAEAPGRGDNAQPGDSKTPGTWIPNFVQQQYFLEITVKVVLPRFKAANQPFVLVYWSRDPDGTQHNQGDSLDALVPGINGPTSLSAIRASDSALAALRQSLRALGLDATTDVIVAADHGFSTISKASRTSPAAKVSYTDVIAHELPPGFVAMDLADNLSRDDAQLRLFDSASKKVVDWKSEHLNNGTGGLIGSDPAAPDVVVAPNGGSDLIYLPTAKAKDLAPKVVQALLAQDYVSGLFVDDALGKPPGTLPLSAIGLKGSALTPPPAIVVNFRSFSTGCVRAVLCTAEVADTSFQQGQGMHGSLSRADTWNFMAATGPDFRKKYVDKMPASNADIGMTLAHLLKLDIPAKGTLTGRVLSESLVGGKPGKATFRTVTSSPAANGLKTVLRQQVVGSTVYSDAAGFPGRTVGLVEK